MSPTRRDVIRLASVLGIAGAAPLSAERIAAMQLLDQPVTSRSVVQDPGAFAERLDGILSGALEDDWLCAINPESHAHYAQARAALQRAVTVTHTREGFQTYGDYEEAFFNLAMDAYYAGLRHGSAYENLRRSVIGEVTECRACWGAGATDNGTCRSCGGTGTVALRA